MLSLLQGLNTKQKARVIQGIKTLKVNINKMHQKRNVVCEENEREQNVITSLKALSLCTVPRKAGTCLGAATAVFHGTLARQSNTFKSTFQIETLLTRIFFLSIFQPVYSTGGYNK